MKTIISTLLFTFIVLSSPVFSQCTISDVFAEPHPCDNDNQFLVDIEFDVNDPGPSNQFEILGNGNNYGTFEYGQNFYTIGPLDGDCQTIYEFVIQDIDNPNCSDFYAFDEPICCGSGDCEISNLVVDPIACTGVNEYSLILDFDYQNTNNLGFDLFANGVFFGFYSYDDLPLTIPNFPASGNDLDHIQVCENDNNDCCADAEFEALDCSGDPCSISNVFAEAYECDNDNMFLVDIAFSYSNPGPSNQFTITGNGMNHGTFEYGQGFYTFGPLEGDCQTIYEFIITDVDDPDCSDFTGFNEPICCNEDCEISNIVVDPIACTGVNEYSLILDFDYQGTTNEYFEVFTSGVLLGYFQFADLPVTIENFPASGDDYDYIVVCENDNNNCCADAEFEALDCSDPEECGIFEVFAEAYECDNDNMFLVDIAFFVENPGPSNQFTITGNGMNYGTFEYGQGFYTIGPLEGDCQTIYEFVITDIDDPECSNFYAFDDPICCNSEDCEIYDIVVDPIACTGVNNYSIALNFEYQGTTNEYFEVFTDGNLLGYFAFADLPVTIENFPASGEDYDYIVICENDNDDCCSEAEFEALDCSDPEECFFDDVNIEQSECMDGSFFVVINFQYGAGNGQTFSIVGNGQIYGTFSYSDLPVIIENLEGDGTTFYEFILIDGDDTECSYEIAYGTVDCNNSGDCSISNLIAEPHECDEDDQFYVDIAFDYSNPGSSNLFIVSVNGANYGTFEYGADFYTIGPLEGDCTTIYEFIVSDVDSPNCTSDYFTFTEPICCETCLIYNLTVETLECTGDDQYAIVVNFAYQGTSGTGFDLFANGDFFGFYDYEDLPLTIEDFPASGEEIDNIEICENDNEECCFSMDFPALECTSCYIEEIEIETSECDGELFNFILDFDYGDGNSNTFFVEVSGVVFGPFNYDDLPVVVGPFEGDNSTEYNISIADADEQNCYAAAEYGAVDCINNLYEPDVAFTIWQHRNALIIKNDNYPIPEGSVYSIYDPKGNLLTTGGIQAGFIDQKLDFRPDNAGLYIIRFRLGEMMFSKKFVMF